MKKFLLSITALFAASSLMAQYDLEAILETPTEGSSVVASNAVSFAMGTRNNGPDAVASGDTIWFSYAVGTSLYSYAGVANNATGRILPAAFPAGVTLPSATTGTTRTLDMSGITTATNVCAIIFGTNGAIALDEDPNDADNDNNFACFTVTPAPLAIDEATAIVASVYPNPASDVLNIKSAEVIASVSVVTMDGKVLLTSASNSVNISELNAGTYVYIVTTVSGATAIGNFAKN